MRSELLALPFLVACASAPKPLPASTVAAAPAGPSLAIDAVTVASMALRGPVLRLEATASETSPVSIRVIEGEGASGERTLATAEASPVDGRVTASLPVSFGQDVEGLRPYQERSTVPLLVEVRQGERRGTRAVVVRSPRWPSARVVNVQSSSPEPGRLEMTLRLVIANPVPWDVRIGTLRASATIAGKELDPLEFTIAAKMPASAEVEYELPVALTAARAGGPKGLTALLRKGELSWTVTGALEAEGLAVPVDLAGVVKVSAQ
jgi:hypothetical protein